MKDAIMVSREIMSAHPNGVRSLFLKYGIGAEPTPRTIILASQAFGNSFIEELYHLYPAKGKNYTGTTLGYSSGLIDYSGPLFQNGGSSLQFDLTGQPIAGATTQDYASGSASGSGGNFWSKFQNIFSNVAGVVNTGVNTWNAVKTGQTAQTTEQAAINANIQAQQYALQMEAEQEANAAKTKQYLVIGAILLLLVVGTVFMFRLKKI